MSRALRIESRSDFYTPSSGCITLLAQFWRVFQAESPADYALDEHRSASMSVAAGCINLSVVAAACMSFSVVAAWYISFSVAAAGCISLSVVAAGSMSLSAEGRAQ